MRHCVIRLDELALAVNQPEHCQDFQALFWVFDVLGNTNESAGSLCILILYFVRPHRHEVCWSYQILPRTD